jgi:hypothetical protein
MRDGPALPVKCMLGGNYASQEVFAKRSLEKRIIIKTPKKVRLKIGLILFGIIVSSLFLVGVDHLSLHSDQAFSPADGRKILEQVQSKLAASPLYSVRNHYAIFICNTQWRRAIFFFANRQAGSIVYHPLSSNVFLSGATIEENRLISPSGKPDVLGRRLDHFIAHEITHVLTGRATGWRRYHDLPTWIKEGYAEYIGSRGTFVYGEAVQAFRMGASKMNTPVAVPYLRYNLLVAYLLEERKWSPRQLFEISPGQDEVEAMLKTEVLDKSGHPF